VIVVGVKSISDEEMKENSDQNFPVRERCMAVPVGPRNPGSLDVEKTWGRIGSSTYGQVLPRKTRVSSEPPSIRFRSPSPSITWHAPPTRGASQRPCVTPLPVSPSHPLLPLQVTTEQQPATTALQQSHPQQVASEQSELQGTALHAGNSFDLNSGFQTMELVSPASTSKVPNKEMHKRYRCDSYSKTTAKPLFAVQGSKKNLGRVVAHSDALDKNQNIYDPSKDTARNYGWDAPVTPQNSDSFESNLQTVIPSVMPPPFPLPSASQLCSPSSHVPNFPSWQPVPSTETIYQPPLPSTLQLSSPPPPLPSPMPQQGNSWQPCHTRMMQPPSPLLPPPPPPPPPPPVTFEQKTVMETSSHPCETQLQLCPPPPTVASDQLGAMRNPRKPHRKPLLQQPPPAMSMSANQLHRKAQNGFSSTEGFQTVEDVSPANSQKPRGKPLLQQSPPARCVWANQLHRKAQNDFGWTKESQTAEGVSPATVLEGVKNMPECLTGVSYNKATSKPLFQSVGSNSDCGMDEDDSVPVSWEDIEDSEFPPLKSLASAADSSDCCDAGTADDWFNVKPGQLEASKWSMTFSKQAVTPPLQCTGFAAHKAASFSAPAAAHPKNCDKKKKRQSLNLFRPDRDDENSESVTDWSEQFKTRYESVITPFYDSHCHLDFLFRRSAFRGSFANYRQSFANTFPSNFAGCVSVFCNPKSWAYESQGKIFVFLFQLYVI